MDEGPQLPDKMIPADIEDDSVVGVEQAMRARIASLMESLQRAESSEISLREQLREANKRIAFLESDVTVPKDAPAVSAWVVGRLRRAVLRVQAVFREFAELEAAVEQFEDARLIALAVLDDLYLGRDNESPYELRSLVSNLEDALRSLADSSVPASEFQKLVSTIAEAEDEICLAIAQKPDAPLRLSEGTVRISI